MDLSHNQIKKIQGLEGLTKLYKLRLVNNQISEIKGLETLKYLEYLDLSNNHIEDFSWFTEQDSLRRLWNLHLWGNLFPEEQLNTLKGRYSF